MKTHKKTIAICMACIFFSVQANALTLFFNIDQPVATLTGANGFQISGSSAISTTTDNIPTYNLALPLVSSIPSGYAIDTVTITGGYITEAQLGATLSNPLGVPRPYGMGLVLSTEWADNTGGMSDNSSLTGTLAPNSTTPIADTLTTGTSVRTFDITSSYNLGDTSASILGLNGNGGTGTEATAQFSVFDRDYAWVGGDQSFAVNLVMVPEPSRAVLLGLGALGLLLPRRRR